MSDDKIEIPTNNDTKVTTIKGILWSMLERFSTMGVQLLCTLVIAQYLSPNQFGLVGMMSIFLSLSFVMAEGGFGQAIIREQNVTILDLSSVFFFNILIGFFVYLLFYLLAPYISVFYEQPELTLLVRVSFLAIVINSLTIVQEALLFKSVSFSRVSRVSIFAVTISGIIGIIVAINFKTVWALIAQSLSNSLIRTILYWHIGSWRPSLIYSWSSVKKYLSFSLNLLFSRMIASVADNAANLFIGKAYSPTDLGNYTVPDKLQKSVAGTISYSIHRVSYPVMATFQDDIEKIRDYSQKIVCMAFYIIAPIMIYMMVVSKQLFSVILSPEWADSAEYFRYMCIIGAIYCFADINLDILIVRGKSKLILYIEIVRKTILVISLIIGILFSIRWLLIILVCYNFLNTLIVNFFAGREIQCSIIKQLFNILPTCFLLSLSTIVSYFVVNSFSNNYISLLISFVSFFSIYVIFSYIFKNPSLKTAISFVQIALKREKGSL